MKNLINKFETLHTQLLAIDEKELADFDRLGVNYEGSDEEIENDKNWEATNKQMQSVAAEIMEKLIAKTEGHNMDARAFKSLNENEGLRTNFILKSIDNGVLIKA